MIDTAQVKALLGSNDLDALQKGLDEIASAESTFSQSSASQQEQLLKLQILLQSRILAVQQQQELPSNELVITYRRLAILWMRSGETEKAVGQLQKALALSGDDPETLQLLARAHLNLSKYDLAIATQEKAIGILETTAASNADPLASAHVQLATVYEAKGEFQQAIALLQKASAMSDDTILSELVQAEIHGKLGIICEKIGEEKQAVESLTKAHDLYVKTKGESYYKTQEIAYLLDMASSA
eukprot:CAMPEP_0172450078 /NCGR_PEP_ID=MMETSP1065-20121228/8582_1 /TAXON_ID=265537 /ORGANISM="Amphiprora paludosa, Strain CCMP125" /LENGTH=241 /DNA_ID=CAMNT_0013201847 /DNA_START=225 /DNA_END=950 /DNA_ORIENTATION=-